MQVEVGISARQAKMFKLLAQQAEASQRQVNVFAAAMFASLDSLGDLDNVQAIQIVEADGKAKLVGTLTKIPMPMAATEAAPGAPTPMMG